MSNFIKIGEISKKTGVSIDTIRFYETKGLLKPVSRTSSGYRYYDHNSINTLIFIKMAKDIGFTLSEIHDFLKINISKKGRCSFTKDKIKNKLTNVNKKINDLKKIKKVLLKVSKECESQKNGDSCKFLELLGENND